MDGVIFALAAPLVIKDFGVTLPEYRSGLQIALLVGWHFRRRAVADASKWEVLFQPATPGLAGPTHVSPNHPFSS